MVGIPRWIRIVSLVATLSAIAVVALLVVSSEAQIDQELLVVHTLDVERALQRFDGGLTMIDGEVKNFVISHAAGWIASYSGDVAAEWKTVDAIGALTADNASQQERISTLRRALMRHLEWCDFVIAEAKQDGFAKALADVAGGPADESLSLVRSTSRDMVAEEERLLIERQSRARLLRGITLTAQVLVGLLGLGSGLAGFFLIRSRFRAVAQGREYLEQSRSYFEAIVATVREPLLVVDRQLQVRSANRAYYLKFGGSMATTEGVDLRELGSGEWSDPDFIARVKAIHEVGTEVEDFIMDRVFEGLGRRLLHLSVKKIFRPGNQSGLVLIAIEDDTARELAVQRLNQVNAELEGFAYTVAHDLRAPLRALQGFSSALAEDFGEKLDEVGRSYTGSIAGAAARMDQLIRDLLEYSRLARSEVKLEAVDLDEVVSAARQQLAGELAEKNATVAVDGPLGLVTAHFATLVQIIVNLLGNAVKFTSPGSISRVRLRSDIGTEKVRLWVEDNGIGIAPDHHERIFKVFERLHGQAEFPGTGIGLAIVRKGVERLGGKVGVESKLGAGARFWIELPSASRHQD